MDNFLDLMLLAGILLVGLYCLWLSFDMRKWKKLRTNPIIYPTGASPEQCLDPEGFLEFMPSKLLIFGLLCLPSALGFGISMTLAQSPVWLVAASVGLALGDIVFYSVVINRAYKLFW